MENSPDYISSKIRWTYGKRLILPTNKLAINYLVQTASEYWNTNSALGISMPLSNKFIDFLLKTNFLLTKVLKNLNDKKYCLVAFLDILQPFDKVWNIWLLFKIREQLSHLYYLLLKSYFFDRLFQVKFWKTTFDLDLIRCSTRKHTGPSTLHFPRRWHSDKKQYSNCNIFRQRTNLSPGHSLI